MMLKLIELRRILMAKIVRKCKACKKARPMYSAGDVNSNHCETCLVNFYNEWQWKFYTDLER